MKKRQYEKEHCDHCDQDITYALGIDKGTVDILRAMYVAIGKKSINIIHPKKEMLDETDKMPSEERIRNGLLSYGQRNNLTRPRIHGLIARVKGEHGNWCITRKGFAFLKGASIPKVAIKSKPENRNIGYFDEYPEGDPRNYTTIDKYLKNVDPYWASDGYEIKEGRVVRPEDI